MGEEVEFVYNTRFISGNVNIHIRLVLEEIFSLR